MNIKRPIKKRFVLSCLFLLCLGFFLEAAPGELEHACIKNERMAYSVFWRDGELLYDTIETAKRGSGCDAAGSIKLCTDADFGINVMWTDWQAPGKANNGDNPVILTKKDFKVTTFRVMKRDGKNEEIELILKGIGHDLELLITYRLRHGAFYVQRKIGVRDSVYSKHFLRKITVLRGVVAAKTCGGDETVKLPATLVKAGGFGQPAALKMAGAGVFWGMEYPAGKTKLWQRDGQWRVSCWQEIGEKITGEWLEGDWAVTALTPDSRVKYWFFDYLDDIRVAPLKPYTLYNSWYDLRAVDYPSKTPTKENNVMNEKNVLRMIGLVRENMIEKHGIKMDAFVLDDGWDVYESDWQLRKEQFPNGMKPIADELKKTGTDLGIWFGPTGGYSARMKRVNWMKEHGYETVGEEKKWHSSMLCLGGEKYGKLFKKRVSDFVKEDGVGFFKWDGIQFSCSEPDHGHAIGIYSRRAVLEKLIDICGAVRSLNPNVYLNITSGTWLSPWWLKYTNQIWMDGRDYAHADVPSISPRDSAMTYRDFVLYEDFKNKDLWFPIANLMTHGIIKGHLQKLGGEAEPIDKFTDNALLYFARGVSMWELYISPDLLTDAEWNAIGKSINWAKDRFGVLMNTVMIGGDPAQRATYGYVHFKGKRGIIAARNPYVEKGKLDVKLDRAWGLDGGAASLVLERVYPTRWVSPELYSTGAEISIPLKGYETAVYEVYPLSEATEPLLAGVTFETVKRAGGTYGMKVYDRCASARLLNPETVKKINVNGKDGVLLSEFSLPVEKAVEPVTGVVLKGPGDAKKGKGGKGAKGKGVIDVAFGVDESAGDGVLAVLLQYKGPAVKSTDKNGPSLVFLLDGKEVKGNVEKQEGLWTWYTVPVSKGTHKAKIKIKTKKGAPPWKGNVSLWVVCRQKRKGLDVSFDLAGKKPKPRSLPPSPWPAGEVGRHIKLGEILMD